jgi:hypothetical protein
MADAALPAARQVLGLNAVVTPVRVEPLPPPAPAPQEQAPTR